MPNSPLHDVIQHRFIQRLVTLLISLVIVGILSTAVYYNIQAYFETIRAGELTTANLARAAEQHAEDAFKELDAFSAGMVERLEHEGLAKADKPRLRRLFKQQSSVMEQIHGVFVFDQDGTWVVTDKDNYPQHANNADREYFAWHRDHAEDKGMHLSPAIRSRTTGEWVIPLSRRLNNPDGSFAGVFLVTVFVDHFNRFYAGFHLDEDGIFVIALQDGTVLTRRPFDEEEVGVSLAQGEIFTKYLPYSAAGTAHIVSVVDHFERIMSYRHIARYPVVVQAGLSVDAVLKPWRHNLYRSICFVSAVTLLLLTLGNLLLRQIRFGVRVETELRSTQATLQRLATEDGLTGLANRRQLDGMLSTETARARRQSTSVAVLMIDIDYFKKYNDRYGHQAGDECLKVVAGALRLCLKRPADAAFRYGGEEFAVILPDTPMDGALKIAHNIRAAVRGLDVSHAVSEFGRVTLSIGVAAQIPVTNGADESLLRSADEALYAAKQGGRDRVVASNA
jgi:diguanylate cyclase